MSSARPPRITLASGAAGRQSSEGDSVALDARCCLNDLLRHFLEGRLLDDEPRAASAAVGRVTTIGLSRPR